jgi:hypothetical protein
MQKTLYETNVLENEGTLKQGASTKVLTVIVHIEEGLRSALLFPVCLNGRLSNELSRLLIHEYDSILPDIHAMEGMIGVV